MVMTRKTRLTDDKPRWRMTLAGFEQECAAWGRSAGIFFQGRRGGKNLSGLFNTVTTEMSDTKWEER